MHLPGYSITYRHSKSPTIGKWKLLRVSYIVRQTGEMLLEPTNTTMKVSDDLRPKKHIHLLGPRVREKPGTTLYESVTRWGIDTVS
jgi:hypothetical protein